MIWNPCHLNLVMISSILSKCQGHPSQWYFGKSHFVAIPSICNQRSLTKRIWQIKMRLKFSCNLNILNLVQCLGKFMGFKVDTLALVMLGNPKALSICSAAQTLNRVSFFTNQFVLFHIVAKTGESGRTGRRHCPLNGAANAAIRSLRSTKNYWAET